MSKTLNYSVKLLRNFPLMTMGILIVLLFVVAALLAPWISPYPQDTLETHTKQAHEPPSLEHLFGTDELGRDVFTRIIYGSRISLMAGIITTVLALLIGVPIGVIAGGSGGIADEIIMRVTDVFLSFPHLLLAMAISTLLGPNLINAMIAIAVSGWPWYARLVRAEAMSVRERDFVEAAMAMGSSWRRILFRHILPNCLVPVIIQVSLNIGAVILTLASLSFLGLGAQSPTPEWGLMISSGRRFFLTEWWVTTFPGIAIFVVVLSFNLIGDSLREILDPRMRRGRKT